jgi:5-methylcytosine-specific restriction enzyme subunit McrC
MANKKSPIAIENLYYILSYAWNILPTLKDITVSKEFINNGFDLLGRIFALVLGKQIKQGFHRSYISREEELSNLRGKIDIQTTIKRLTFFKKKLNSLYDEFSENDPFNQIIRYTIQSLLKNSKIHKSIKSDLKKIDPFFSQIDLLEPSKTVRKKLTFNKYNSSYKLLISICILLYDNSLISEKTGEFYFKDFYRDEQMSLVFQTFIFNFYSKNLYSDIYKIHSPKIFWNMDKLNNVSLFDIFDVDNNPGDRRTDIVIENKITNLQIIIDAKYYRETFVNAFMNSEEKRIRTSHLNQIRGYLLDSNYLGDKIGLLLYPMTESNVNKGKLFPIKPHKIIIKTIDFNLDWRIIESDLISFIKKIDQIK